MVARGRRQTGHCRPGDLVLRRQAGVAGGSNICVSPMGRNHGRVHDVVANGGSVGGRLVPVALPIQALGAREFFCFELLCVRSVTGTWTFRHLLFSVLVCSRPLPISCERGNYHPDGMRNCQHPGPRERAAAAAEDNRVPGPLGGPDYSDLATKPDVCEWGDPLSKDDSTQPRLLDGL